MAVPLRVQSQHDAQQHNKLPLQSSELPAVSCFIAIFFELVNYEQLEDLRNA